MSLSMPVVSTWALGSCVGWVVAGAVAVGVGVAFWPFFVSCALGVASVLAVAEAVGVADGAISADDRALPVGDALGFGAPADCEGFADGWVDGLADDVGVDDA